MQRGRHFRANRVRDVSDSDLFSPARLRAKWRRAGKPDTEDDPGTEEVTAPVAAEPPLVSLVEQVSDLRRHLSEQIPVFDRFMEHGFDCLTDGVETGDPVAMAAALNSIEDLIDESGLKSR